MSKPIQQNSTNNTLRAVVYNTDGSVKTDLAHDTTGISIVVQKIGVADGSAMSLSAKSGTTWAAGAFLNLGGGDISVDIADAVLTSYLGEVRIYGTFTGGVIVGTWCPVVAYNPNAVAVGANTTTPTNLSAAQVRTELATELARIDAAISTRSTFAGLGTNAPADWINAAAIAASALDGKGNWNVGKTGYALTQAFPSNFAALDINVSGEITTSNPASGGGSAHTAQDVADLILATPANKLATDASGKVTVGTNDDKTGYSLTQAFPANFASLGINSSGHISRVTLVDTTTDLTNGGGGGGLDAAGVRAAIGLASANLDTQLGTIDTVVDVIAVEVGKIPRGASAIAAGGNATRTKVSANGTTLVEAIT